MADQKIERPIREAILQSFRSRRMITVPPLFLIACANNPSAAIMLAQLMYWSDSTPNKNDHWVYKSATDWQVETGLTSRRVETAGKVLVKLGVVRIKVMRAKGHPTRWYKINVLALSSLLGEMQEAIDDIMGVDYETGQKGKGSRPREDSDEDEE